MAALALTACSLPSASAEAARVWSQPTELRAAGGEPIQSPTVTFTSRGEMLATWAPDYRLPDGSVPGMQFAARPVGGGFGPASTLDTQQHLARFEADRDGGAFLAWVRHGQQLVVAYRPAGGPIQPPIALGRGNYGLALATNAAGDAVIVYNRYGYVDFGAPQDGRQLYTSFRPAGGSFGPPQPVSALIPDPVNSEGLDVALLPDGRALYVWEEAAGASTVVKTTIRRRTGEIEAPATLSRPGRGSFMPKVATDAVGNAFAVWAELGDRTTYGPVIASHRPTLGSFGPPRETGGSTGWAGPDLGVSDRSEAVIAFQSIAPLAGGGGQQGPPTAVIGNAATGSLGLPHALANRATLLTGLATNPAGDALVWFRDFFEGHVEVARRTPGVPFGMAQAVRCAPPGANPWGAAVAPGGKAALLSYVPYQQTEISEETGSDGAALRCGGGPSWPPPNHGLSPGPATSRRPAVLGFSARVVTSGARSSPSVRVRVDCNQPCLVKASGDLKGHRRSKALRLRSARLIMPTAGTRRITLSLGARGKRLIAHATSRRSARATVRLSAQGAVGAIRRVTLRNIRP